MGIIEYFEQLLLCCEFFTSIKLDVHYNCFASGIILWNSYDYKIFWLKLELRKYIIY